MSIWMKIKVWTKIGFFSIIALYVALFAIFNLGTKASLWFYPGTNGSLEAPVLLLAIGAFLLGGFAVLLTRTILSTLAQMREMKRKKMEKEAVAIISRASKLRTRDQAASQSESPSAHET